MYNVVFYLSNYYIHLFQHSYLETQYYLKNEYILKDLLDRNILLEGAQGSGLSINSENYPNVTSSYPTIGGALNATNLNHKEIDEVIGVIKSYKTKSFINLYN